MRSENGTYQESFRDDRGPNLIQAKHGVVGLTRAIAEYFYVHDKIRVNCLCSGIVCINFSSEEAWEMFPKECFTPIEKIVEVMLRLVDGADVQDANGNLVKRNDLWTQKQLR